ncbi:Zinc finger protein 440 [Merluccius polli]|uniref:Zinc finger protein 440 n=1 Tax=Merluccius polli TaxID=89951 RepID=A0AA47P431_MERPO|nr:Zinc finger protein 440 [Merluccius polli]
MYPSNMSKIEEIRVYVNERLRSAAAEILGVVEKTITDYEDQASYLKRETDRQRNLLDIVLRPKLPENGQFQPPATTTHQPVAGIMCQPFPVREPSQSSEPLCAFTSREEFLKFASVGYCPYCCKATEASEIHLIKRHYFFAIHFTDKGVEKFTVPCTCKERIKGRSHWHCPDCGKTIYRKNNFEMHLSKQHGHLLLQQSQDPETYQASAAFGEEDGPPEEWLWPEFNNLDQEEDEEEPPSLPHIKEEQEPLWIGLEGGREFQVPPEWPCRKPQEELEKLHVKKEEEERNDWCGEEEEVAVVGGPPHGPQNSMATVAHQDPALTSSSTSSSHFGNVQDEVERAVYATTSSMMPDVDAHLAGQSTRMMALAGTWQQQQHQQQLHQQQQQPHDDCSLGNYKDPVDGQRERGGAWSGLKTLRSKRAKHHGKTNVSHGGLKCKRPGRFSPFQSARGPHRCKLCGKAFYCVVTLLKHAQTHAQDAPCVCVVCGTHLESREGLLQHLQTHKENFNTFEFS